MHHVVHLVCECLHALLRRVRVLTFHHDHVDIYGANWRLRQTLPFLQDVGDFSRGDAVVRFASERHQLPDGHSWRTSGKGNRKQETRKMEKTILEERKRGKMEMKKTRTQQGGPTITPHVTLMGELPVVDAFQSHPFNGHLRREKYRRKHFNIEKDTPDNLPLFPIFGSTADLSFNPAFVRYRKIDKHILLGLIRSSPTLGSSIVGVLVFALASHYLHGVK